MASDGTLVFDTSLNTDGLQKGTSGLGGIARNALGVFTGNLMTKATQAVVNLGKEALNSGMSQSKDTFFRYGRTVLKSQR